ncbi:unnamed protein product [Amoebophrya sp. A120]|nr:unnamed protein product [Amoebophrya sp. A120]|eukprot:GSA120T00017435001.1
MLVEHQTPDTTSEDTPDEDAAPLSGSAAAASSSGAAASGSGSASTEQASSSTPGTTSGCGSAEHDPFPPPPMTSPRLPADHDVYSSSDSPPPPPAPPWSPAVCVSHRVEARPGCSSCNLCRIIRDADNVDGKKHIIYQ